MNKRIIITGATKGIGRAIAMFFAEKGFDIAINSRSREDLEEFKATLLHLNPNIEVLIKPTDQRDQREVQAFAKMILDKWDKFDIVVNNAGFFHMKTILEEAPGDLEKMMETNLYGSYHLCRALTPTMIKNNAGHIFNICSVASKTIYPQSGSYGISKFAFLGFSKILREELKGKGVKVTSVLPGATWSDSWTGVELPESRLMQADDIAKSIWGIYNLGDSAVVEEITLRPQLGDL